MTYQLQNERVLYEWIEAQTDVALVKSMLDWLPKLATGDPPYAQRLPRPGVPFFTAPVTGVSNTMCTYAVVEQYQSIHLVSIDLI